MHRVCVDSRQLTAGALFFALAGARVDGHQFLHEVADKGACGAVVSESYVGPSYGLTLYPVKDVLAELHRRARIKFSAFQGVCVAVSGSVGKSSTKEFLATLLSSKYRVVKSPGNSNSQIGLPLFLLNDPLDGDVVVLEMGMSEPGQIRKLVEIAPPDVGVLTKVGHSHLQAFHEGIIGVAKEKAEIFSHPKTQFGVIGGGAEIYGEVLHAGTCEKVIVSKQPLADFGPLPFTSTHFLENLQTAVVTARILGCSVWEIGSKISQLSSLPKRFETILRGGAHFINDAYNASPESMEAALRNLPQPEGGGRRIAVLGEMSELGSLTQEKHRELGQLALKQVEHLLCFGKETALMVDLFRCDGRSALHFMELGALKTALFSLVKPQDVVLIKGRNVNRLWEVLE